MKRKVMLILVVALLLVSCGSKPQENSTEWKRLPESQNLSYHIFYVEGMPCLQINTMAGSITCDWSKWEGSGGG